MIREILPIPIAQGADRVGRYTLYPTKNLWRDNTLALLLFGQDFFHRTDENLIVCT